MNRSLTASARTPIYDLDLLRQLRGSSLAGQLRVLCVIGAHRFDEAELINRLFPSLTHIIVFEPLPGPLVRLRELASADARLIIVPAAVSDQDGTAIFHVTDNDGQSSSLLEFGSHSEHFPQVKIAQTIEVATRRVDSVFREQGLPLPDMLLIDVQGAEYQVLQTLVGPLLSGVRFIYAEVSHEPLYQGGRPLSDVEGLLEPRFVNIGYAPLLPHVPMHGNAVFVSRSDLDAAFQLTWRERLRRAWHARRPRSAS